MTRRPHDQRFKTLIREFFGDFFALFFAEWLDILDLSRTEWLEQELMPDPPHGPAYVLDLVAKVRSRQAFPPWHDPENPEWLIAVLIEIESKDSSTSIRDRLPVYAANLRAKLGLPVLPIVLLLNTGFDGIGRFSYTLKLHDLVLEHSEYLYVGLPALDAVQYLEGENWLGVALSALMRIPPERVAWLGAEALRRLAGAPLETGKKRLLGECVQAYLPMTEVQRNEFKALLKSEAYTEVRAMNVTVYEEGIEVGLQKGEAIGFVKGRIEAMLELKFGDAGTALMPRVRPLVQIHVLERLVARLRSAATLEEFARELP